MTKALNFQDLLRLNKQGTDWKLESKSPKVYKELEMFSLYIEKT